KLPLHSVHLLRRDDGSLSLNELTDLYTSLSKKVEGLRSELKQTKQTYSTAITKLILRVKKLEQKGRKISAIDKDPTISLVQPEQEMEHDVGIAEIVEDQGSGEKGEKEVSTVGAEHSTVIPEVSTAATNLVYIRRSAHKRKDKGKAIMEEDESVQKKTKKQLEQEILGHEEAIRLQEQIDEEER
ncbi:hypothetical protein Tco_0224427, partial [Tanacetum coccineum]